MTRARPATQLQHECLRVQVSTRYHVPGRYPLRRTGTTPARYGVPGRYPLRCTGTKPARYGGPGRYPSHGRQEPHEQLGFQTIKQKMGQRIRSLGGVHSTNVTREGKACRGWKGVRLVPDLGVVEEEA